MVYRSGGNMIARPGASWIALASSAPVSLADSSAGMLKSGSDATASASCPAQTPGAEPAAFNHAFHTPDHKIDLLLGRTFSKQRMPEAHERNAILGVGSFVHVFDQRFQGGDFRRAQQTEALKVFPQPGRDSFHPRGQHWVRGLSAGLALAEGQWREAHSTYRHGGRSTIVPVVT